MNNLRPCRLVLPLCALLLAGCAGQASRDSEFAAALPPCTAEGTPFSSRPFPWDGEAEAWADESEWSERYHATVGKVVNETLGALNGKSPNGQRIVCTAGDYRAMLKPGTELRTLAQTLSPWKDNDEALASLSAIDAPIVLMEYLRTYECASQEHETWTREEIEKERAAMDDPPRMTYDTLDKEMARRRRILEEERLIARPALERTLVALAGSERLRPLMADITCLQRTSIDLRNAVALGAEASMCLPRAGDAHGSLRFGAQ